FYITIGSGIGGGFAVAREIYRGGGKGGAEIGQVGFVFEQTGVGPENQTLESGASGWGISRGAAQVTRRRSREGTSLWRPDQQPPSAEEVAAAAAGGDACAQLTLGVAIDYLAAAICHVIALLCPRRIVIGGGVSLMGDQLFRPLRERVSE